MCVCICIYIEIIFSDETLNSTGYTKWQSGEPDHTGHCVVVQNTGHFHDTPCTDQVPFVCEQEI